VNAGGAASRRAGTPPAAVGGPAAGGSATPDRPAERSTDARGGAPRGFALRLKRTVEVLEAEDGDVYLLRDGADDDLVLDRPDHAQRALLAALERGAPSLAALRRELASAASAVDAATLAEAVDALARLGLLEDDPGEAERLLGAEARVRYDRQLAYLSDLVPGRAAELQARLGGAAVTVVGVGGIGTWTAAALAAAGIGRLTLVDDDRIDLPNLNRQVLYRRSDVGRLKVDVAADALAAFNPALEIVPVARRVDGPQAAADVIAGADVVVEAADWPPYELSRWLDAACRAAGAARIAAGQIPPRVRIGPTYLPDGRTGCVECQERAARREHPLFDEVVALRRKRQTVAATLGPASAIVGGALAMETLHLLTGAAEPATLGAAVILDLRDFSVTRQAFARDPGCPRCGAGARRLDPAASRGRAGGPRAGAGAPR
jgi:bacteriocin biosynthesis cyclodehydratase domain-containing protein